MQLAYGVKKSDITRNIKKLREWGLCKVVAVSLANDYAEAIKRRLQWRG